MCQICVNGLKEFFPSLPEDKAGDFLLSVTCFPFGCGDRVYSQLKEIDKYAHGDIDRAYFWSEAIFMDVPYSVIKRKELIKKIINERYPNFLTTYA